jgi:N-acetylglucosamine-6-phosphate deacetylase
MSEMVVSSSALALPDGVAPGWLRVRDGLIVELGREAPPGGVPAARLPTGILTPGFVDLHVHGGGGGAVNCDDRARARDGVRSMAAFHARHGTTALLATTVSDTPERILESVAGAARAVREGPEHGARVIGVHLEGPWISARRPGAQDPAAVRGIDPGELEALLGEAAGAISLVTLAPELPGAGALIARLRARGIVVAIGHTDADFGQASQAFSLGARHVAHLFNAMPPLGHRAPGPVGAALTRDDVSVELVADGHHVHPSVIKLVFRLSARPVLVTDAIPATGVGDGRHRIGAREVLVTDGRAALADDPSVLAGSTLTMDRAVRTAVDAGVDLAAALRAATLTPASVIGRDDLGRLAPGARADLVALSPDLAVQAVLIDGRPVHDPARLFEA